MPPSTYIGKRITNPTAAPARLQTTAGAERVIDWNRIPAPSIAATRKFGIRRSSRSVIVAAPRKGSSNQTAFELGKSVNSIVPTFDFDEWAMNRAGGLSN